MIISLVAAAAENGVIGANNSLPWHLPEDLRHFKALTMGKPMIMGRKTFDAIGKPLPGRTTLVVTRQHSWQRQGVVVCRTLDEAIEKAAATLQPGQEEIMVVGGGEIYRQSLPRAGRIYLTKVSVTVDGDTFFPEINPEEWCLLKETEGHSNAAGLDFRFLIYERR